VSKVCGASQSKSGTNQPGVLAPLYTKPFTESIRGPFTENSRQFGVLVAV
jgi:hypothetical protein